ncbi:fibrillin-2 isoform X3 [Nematostella vectensis]|uniref:fibrillin-2 isoform X3 n=1 Tax=Nematostella vectensis TaxID=45351 RepID=UPI002076E5C4|nr:fibrillin-2 isoform X3 [Nematostella vectensis]
MWRYFLHSFYIFFCLILTFALTKAFKNKQFQKEDNKYLNVTEKDTFHVDKVSQCAVKSLKDDSLLSFNFKKERSNDGKYLCEVLRTDRYINWKNYTDNAGYQHFNAKSDCISRPCQHGATCLAQYPCTAYICSCTPGYTGKHCETDTNECTDGSHTCSINAACTNTVGSFTCACNAGYTGNGHTCQDTNECVDGSHTCSINAACTNTVGSFTCACNAGYTGNGHTCQDTNECADGSHTCSINAACTNTVGSFTCACNAGYTGNGHTCQDTNECVDGSHTCSINAACTNTVGSFTCACNAGYTGNGHTCQDTNECADGSHTCSINAACTNTVGSFTCACNAGYTGNGHTCQDTNECVDGSHTCSINAACTNTVGSFTCACNAGYTGNGHTCQDTNECADGSHTCSINAACTNTVGSFTCACNAGYTGNGHTCQAKYISISITSRGLDDPYFQWGNSIMVNNVNLGPVPSRGHNIVALYPTGALHSSRSFDTYGHSGSGNNMANYLNSLPNNMIVLVSVLDSGETYGGPAASALASVGAVEPVLPLGYRESWALIGYKGGSKPWIKQARKTRYNGPAVISAYIQEVHP